MNAHLCPAPSRPASMFMALAEGPENGNMASAAGASRHPKGDTADMVTPPTAYGAIVDINLHTSGHFIASEEAATAPDCSFRYISLSDFEFCNELSVFLPSR